MFKRVVFFRYYLYWVMYSSMLEMVVRGIFRIYDIKYEVYWVIFLQATNYILPIFLCWFGKLTIRFGLALIAIAFALLIIPFVAHNDVISNLMGLKNYFMVLFYVPILQYQLEKDPDFEPKIMRQFIIMAFLWLCVTIWEGISLYIYPNVWYGLFRLLGQQAYGYEQMGLSFDKHSTGAIMTFAYFYCYFKNRYFLFSLFLFGAIISVVKTWLTFGLFLLIVHLFIRGQMKRVFKVFLVIMPFLIINLVLFPEYGIGRLVAAFRINDAGSGNAEMEDPGTERMIERAAGMKFSDIILPHGYYFQSQSGVYDVGVDGDVPEYVYDTEYVGYRMLYHYGVLGMFFYLLAIYFPLISLRNGWVFNNDYKYLLLVSLIAYIHTFDTRGLYIYIIVILFSLLALQAKRVGPA